MKILLTLAVSGAALAATFAAAPAFAQSAPPATIAVHTADLDLRSPAGLAALDRRINAAVEIACGELYDVDLHGNNVAQRCRATTRAEAAAQRSNAIAFARHGGGTTLAAQ